MQFVAECGSVALMLCGARLPHATVQCSLSRASGGSRSTLENTVLQLFYMQSRLRVTGKAELLLSVTKNQSRAYSHDPSTYPLTMIAARYPSSRSALTPDTCF